MLGMTELITTKEAASILHCATSTIQTYVRKRRLVPDKKSKGGSYFFAREKILGFRKLVSTHKKTSFNPSSYHGLPEVELMDIIEKWQVNSKDKASADIQIGVYTEKIIRLESELRRIPTEDPEFKQMRYKLLWHVGERRKLLHYLEISNYGRYRKAIALLEKEGQVA